MRISRNIKLIAQVGSFALLGVLFLMCDAQTAKASVLTKPANNLGIVAYYPFIEGSGTTTADYSGQNLKATLTTAPTWTASGKFGYGLDFSAGSFQYLSVPHNAALNFSYAMTYAAWVKPTLGTQVSLISKGAYGDAFRVLIQGGTAPERVPAIQIDGATIYGTTAIVSGSWTHVAFTYDGVVTKIYVNGALTDTSTSANGILATTATTMYIGQGGSDNIYYNGVMDEVYLFQRALSAAEIATLYARTPTGGRQRVINSKQSYNDGLVFYAPLDDGDSTIARNYGSSGVKGPLTNFALTGSTSNWVAGKRNGALNFDGTNDIVNFGNKSELYLRSNLSIFAWVKTTDTAASIVSWGSSGTGGIANGQYGLGRFGAGGAGLNTYIGGTWRSGSSFNDGNWHHVGYTLTSGGSLQFYLDGATDGAAIATGSQFSVGASNSLVLGADDETTNYTFAYNGSLDEVRIYNRALSSTEVANLYADTGIRKLKTNVSANTIASGSLTAWHTFDGPYLNTTTSTDRSGQGKDGTLSGTPTPTIGKVGQALKFNGSTSYVTTPTVSTPSAISVAAWVYSANYGAAMFVVEKAVVNSEWQLFFENGNLYWATNNHDLVCTAPANDTWHHIVATQTGSSGRLYIDGVQCATGESVPAIGQGTGLIWIGAYDNFYGSIGYPFNGKIDDVRIYNKALSAAEVLTLYNQTK